MSDFRGGLGSQSQALRQKKHRYKGCAKYLHRFDEMIMKPLFIYRYERKQQKKSQEFFRLFQQGGDEIERDYAAMEQRRQLLLVD